MRQPGDAPPSYDKTVSDEEEAQNIFGRFNSQEVSFHRQIEICKAWERILMREGAAGQTAPNISNIPMGDQDVEPTASQDDLMARTLCENYTFLRDHLLPTDVIPILRCKGVLSNQQYQVVQDKRTDGEKTDYIINQCILGSLFRRGQSEMPAKQQLMIFSSALKQTDQSHLLPYLPYFHPEPDDRRSESQ